jgi:hypothetical protein
MDQQADFNEKPGPALAWMPVIPWPGGALSSQAQLLDDASVSLDVGLCQVIQQPSSLSYKHQKPPAGVVIFLVSLEVLGEVIDSLGEDGNLHFGGPGVPFLLPEILDDLFLFFLGHDKTNSFSIR